MRACKPPPEKRTFCNNTNLSQIFEMDNSLSPSKFWIEPFTSVNSTKKGAKIAAPLLFIQFTYCLGCKKIYGRGIAPFHLIDLQCEVIGCILQHGLYEKVHLF